MVSSPLVKRLLLAAGLLAIVLFAGLFLRRPHPGSYPYASTADSAESIMLKNSGVTLYFLKSTAGWEIRESTGGPRFRADGAKVKTFLESLKRLQLEDVISEKPENAGDFEVNPDSAGWVTLSGKNGAKLSDGLFGKAAPDQTHLYFKYPDRPQVYLARGATRDILGPPGSLYWRDLTLWSLAEDQVLTLFIEAPGFKTALARSSDTWSANGHLVEPASVWGVLGALAHLTADGVVSGQTPGKLTYATVHLQMKDGSIHQLKVGALESSTHHFPVAVDDQPSVYAIQEAAVRAILLKPSAFPPKK